MLNLYCINYVVRVFIVVLSRFTFRKIDLRYVYTYVPVIVCVLFIVIKITDRTGLSSIMTVIHTVTIGTMLNNNSVNHGNVTCRLLLDRSA